MYGVLYCSRNDKHGKEEDKNMCLYKAWKVWEPDKPPRIRKDRVYWKLTARASDGSLYPRYIRSPHPFFPTGPNREADYRKDPDVDRLEAAVYAGILAHDMSHCYHHYPIGFHAFLRREDAEAALYDIVHDLYLDLNNTKVVPVRMSDIVAYGTQLYDGEFRRVVVARTMEFLAP